MTVMNWLSALNRLKGGRMKPLICPFQTTFAIKCLKFCPPTDDNTEHIWTISPGEPSAPTTAARETDACTLHPCMHIKCNMTDWRVPRSWVEDGRMVSLGWLATPALPTAKNNNLPTHYGVQWYVKWTKDKTSFVIFLTHRSHVWQHYSSPRIPELMITRCLCVIQEGRGTNQKDKCMANSPLFEIWGWRWWELSKGYKEKDIRVLVWELVEVVFVIASKLAKNVQEAFWNGTYGHRKRQFGNISSVREIC